MTTNKRLDAIKERLGKAIEGEWWLDYRGNGEVCKPAVVRAHCLRIIVDHSENFGDPNPDAEMIAHSKQDIEYLLSLVEKQRDTLLALKHQSHHTIEEEMWRIEQALKCDEGGEVGK